MKTDKRTQWMVVVALMVFFLASGGRGVCGEVPFTRTDLATQEDHSWGDVQVGDINNDGVPDIQAGIQWFEGPNWDRHAFASNPGNIYGTGTCILYDIDRDGDLDILTYIYGPYRYVWYENPGPPSTGNWSLHIIRGISTGWPEGKYIVDIDDDGEDELITLEKDGSGVQSAEIPANPEVQSNWVFTQISTLSGHGLGIGDLNQDGLLDVVVDYNWMEQLADGGWVDHSIPQRPTDSYRPTETTNPLVYDFDGDGDNDIFLPRAHNYGAYWLEPSGGGSPTFTLHEVLPGQLPSQFYGAAYGDIDGDGDVDVFGGQCHYVHSDPGEADPPDVFWIETIPSGVSGGVTWVKHQLSTELKMGRCPSIADLDGDGDVDLVMRPIGFGAPRELPPKDQFDVTVFLNESAPDTTPPTIESVTASGDPTKVAVVFSEPVEESSAEAASNYAIGNGIGVDSASLGADLKTVTLTVSPELSEGVTYTLTVNNVTDRAVEPNTIAADSQATFAFVAFQTAKVNFQPATVNNQSGAIPVPADYVADAGEVYSAVRGYGWDIDITADSRDRDVTADQRLDTFNHLQKAGNRVWEYALPNGDYEITVAAGDAAYTDSVHQINAEGTAAISGFVPTAGDMFREATVTVTVADGRLTVDGVGGTNSKICFIEIASSGPASVMVVAYDPDASEEGPDTGGFRISRTGSVAAALTVDVEFTGSTAGYGADYTLAPDISGGSVQIDAGQSYVDVVVTPNSDADYAEGDETVVVTIVDGAGYAAGTLKTATVMIADYVPNAPGPFSLIWPADAATALTVEPTLSWGISSEADDYTVTIYSDASMTVEVDSANVMAPTTGYTVPAAALAWDTQYWWKVTAHNVIGETDASNNGISFYTTPPGAPSVSSMSPSDGEGDVDVGTDVRITFSEPLDAATVVAGCVTLDDGLGGITGSVSLDADGRTVVFAPDGDLAEETGYTITVAGTIADKAGNAFAGGTYGFITTWEPLTGLARGDGCAPAAAGAGWLRLLLLALAAVALRKRRS